MLPGAKGELMKRGIGVIAVCLILVGACNQPAQPSEAEQQEDARIQLLADPSTGPIFQRLEIYYPAETQAMLDQTLAIYRRGGSQEEAGAVVRATMMEIVNRNAVHASRAEPAALRASAQTTLDSLDVLQREDVEACQEMLLQENLSSETRRRQSRDVHRVLATVTVATLDAIHSGQTNPREYAPLLGQDYEAMFSKFEALGGDREVLRTLMGEAGGSLSPDVACRTGRLFWSAILSAPGDFPERYMSSIWTPDAPT
jgi:BMFP domain-containing protein YqiC